MHTHTQAHDGFRLGSKSRQAPQLANEARPEAMAWKDSFDKPPRGPRSMFTWKHWMGREHAWWCEPCGAWADEAHISSKKHTKNEEWVLTHEEPDHVQPGQSSNSTTWPTSPAPPGLPIPTPMTPAPAPSSLCTTTAQRVDNIEASLSMWAGTMNQWSQVITAWESSWQSTSKKLDKIESCLVKMDAFLQTLDERMGNVESRVTTMEEGMKTTTEQIKKTESHTTELEDAVTHTRDQVRSVKNILQTTEDMVGQCTERAERLEDRVRKTMNFVDELDTRVARTESRVDKLESWEFWTS